MTIQEVNEAYQKIDNIEARIPSIQWINPTMIIIAISLIAIFISVLVINALIINTKEKKIRLEKDNEQTSFWTKLQQSMRKSLGLFLTLILLYSAVYFMCVLVLYGQQKYDLYDLQGEQFKQWKTEYAIPYIESLPVEKHRIVYIKIDPEIKTSWDSTFFLGSGYINVTSEELTALTISYQDNKKLVTETNWYDSGMELSKSNEPYIEYHNLKEELGDGSDFPIGHYNPKVYIPEGYRFDTIK